MNLTLITKNNYRQYIFSIVDLFVAISIFVAVNGITFLNSDNVATIPYSYGIVNDITYSTKPPIIYGLSNDMINIFGKLFPVEIVHCLFILLSLGFLLLAINKIVKSISQYDIPFSLIIILLLGPGSYNWEAIAGFHFIASDFSSHSPARAFGLFALSLFIANRRIAFNSILFIVLAIIFNVRVGAFAFSLLILMFLFFNKVKYRYFILLCCSLLGLLLTCYMDYYYSGASYINEAIRILAFVRNSYHYLPQVFPNYIFTNLLMIFLFFLYLFHIEIKYRFIIIPIFLCYIGVLVNVLNNIYMFSPFIALLEMYQFGPFILIFFYILLLCFIVKKLSEKYYFSLLTIVFVPNLQLTLLFLIIFIVSYHLVPLRFEILSKIKIKCNDLISFICQAIVFFLIYFIDFSRVNTLFMRIDLFKIYLFVLCCVVLLVLALIPFKKERFRFLIPFVVFLLVCVSLLLEGRPNYLQKKFLCYSDYRDKQWFDICKYCEKNTPVNSCFLIPPAQHSFQFLSKRAAFCSRKNVPYDKHIIEWANRFKDIKAIPENVSFSSLSRKKSLNLVNYNSLTTEQIKDIANKYKFVNYIITCNKQLNLPIIYNNKKYVLYSLSNDDIVKYQDRIDKAYRELRLMPMIFKKNKSSIEIDRLENLIAATPYVINLLSDTERTELTQVAEFCRKKSNIVTNSGAEDGCDGIPVGWRTKRQLLNKRTGWGSDVVHLGVHSLKIIGNGQREAYWVSEMININEPVRSFRISAWAFIDRNTKFTHREGQVYLAVDFKLKNKKRPIYKTFIFDLSKTNQWQNITADETFRADVEAVKIFAVCHLGVGTVWFDDIEISPLKEIYSLLLQSKN